MRRNSGLQPSNRPPLAPVAGVETNPPPLPGFADTSPPYVSQRNEIPVGQEVPRPPWGIPAPAPTNMYTVFESSIQNARSVFQQRLEDEERYYNDAESNMWRYSVNPEYITYRMSANNEMFGSALKTMDEIIDIWHNRFALDVNNMYPFNDVPYQNHERTELLREITSYKTRMKGSVAVRESAAFKMMGYLLLQHKNRALKESRDTQQDNYHAAVGEALAFLVANFIYGYLIHRQEEGFDITEKTILRHKSVYNMIPDFLEDVIRTRDDIEIFEPQRTYHVVAPLGYQEKMSTKEKYYDNFSTDLRGYAGFLRNPQEGDKDRYPILRTFYEEDNEERMAHLVEVMDRFRQEPHGYPGEHGNILNLSPGALSEEIVGVIGAFFTTSPGGKIEPGKTMYEIKLLVEGLADGIVSAILTAHGLEVQNFDERHQRDYVPVYSVPRDEERPTIDDISDTLGLVEPDIDVGNLYGPDSGLNANVTRYMMHNEMNGGDTIVDIIDLRAYRLKSQNVPDRDYFYLFKQMIDSASGQSATLIDAGFIVIDQMLTDDEVNANELRPDDEYIVFMQHEIPTNGIIE